MNPVNWNILSLNSRFLQSNNHKILTNSNFSQMRMQIDNELGSDPGSTRTKVL